ncbi:MAG: hypothetical protein ACT4QB_08080 [Gammaproteobacteria bacterium]
MKKVFNIVGARPNFMKMAPGRVPVLVRTGQHGAIRHRLGPSHGATGT